MTDPVKFNMATITLWQRAKDEPWCLLVRRRTAEQKNKIIVWNIERGERRMKIEDFGRIASMMDTDKMPTFFVHCREEEVEAMSRKLIEHTRAHVTKKAAHWAEMKASVALEPKLDEIDAAHEDGFFSATPIPSKKAVKP